MSGSYGWNESINDNPYAFYNKSISDGFSAGINIRWDIFRGGKKIIANKNASINQENFKLNKEKINLTLRKELNNAFQSHLNNLFILDAQNQNFETNKNQIFRINKADFKSVFINSYNPNNRQLRAPPSIS